ncbi:hypothetical protein DSO57_1028319 [Entomophthora muscae]|uniref:Uncharacterized protein n=1 Tax=Entomophthora muscae TaxID=34485 RepID=A0ACC2U001_9FUNG|nr:hypothetical protein DSO57_1028319 [Entomophthora muscae]
MVLLFKSSLQNSKSKKFVHKWKGPYTIVGVEPYYNYRIMDQEGKELENPVNGRRLKKCPRFLHEGKCDMLDATGNKKHVNQLQRS